MRPRKHHIYLSSSEREELERFAECETPARAKRAKALLLADEGELGPGLHLTHISAQLGFSVNYTSQLVAKAERNGAVDVAFGHTWESASKHRGITPEMDQALAEEYALGKFTKSELARRFNVANSSVDRMLKRSGRE